MWDVGCVMLRRGNYDLENLKLKGAGQGFSLARREEKLWSRYYGLGTKDKRPKTRDQRTRTKMDKLCKHNELNQLGKHKKPDKLSKFILWRRNYSMETQKPDKPFIPEQTEPSGGA